MFSLSKKKYYPCLDLRVSFFFTVSAFFFRSKIPFDFKTDARILKHYVHFVISILFKYLLLLFCAIPQKNGKTLDFSMLKKMLITIFFTHFVFVIVWRTSVEKMLTYEYDFQEIFIVVSCTVFVSYIIAKLSNKFKPLNYLYLKALS